VVRTILYQVTVVRFLVVRIPDKSIRQQHAGLDEMKSTVLATALLLTATGAVAAPPAEQSAPAASAATDGGAEPQAEKKICRSERTTGSRTHRTRLCLTAAQWRELQDQTYRGVSDMQRQNGARTGN
jgi:hypothetical protein